MKAIYKLRQCEKAKMLHRLFPEQIAALLSYLTERCLQMERDRHTIKKHWKGTVICADHWLRCITSVNAKLLRYGKRLEKSPTLFANQLFDGDRAAFSTELLKDYLHDSPSLSPKFALAIKLFFYP